MRSIFSLVLCLAAGTSLPAQNSLPTIPEIERRIPPLGGVELPAELRESLESRVAEYDDRLAKIEHSPHAADVGALVKAVDFALRFDEFYNEKELPVAGEMLDLADKRYRELTDGASPSWTDRKGLVVRGYRSSIDESFQPFGLEIPENLDLSKPVPVLVWLHGRGDKVTDLHFLKRCLTKSQALGGFVADQQDCIVIHPFGRHCVGWKHAGEIDVFEAIEKLKEDYPIDPDRIALAGFSMGGAGAWHIGAHYRDQFCAVHAGAGFSETKEYIGLAPDDFPPDYEQTLWKLYDVPNYARNFRNGPLLAYSGGEDKQKQAADVMERELAKVGHDMRHVVGEGMGHKYNQESTDEIWAWLKEAWEKGRSVQDEKVVWQTPTLRYPGYGWLQLRGLESHWQDAVATAEKKGESNLVSLDLENVTALEIFAREGEDLGGSILEVDGERIAAEDPAFPVRSLALLKKDGAWTWGEPGKMSKRPGIQGPIDDAFLRRFVVVPPTIEPRSPTLARWVAFEAEHFRQRWSELLRGDLLEKAAEALDSDDIAEANLVLWGDPASNPMIAEIVERLPIQWDEDSFSFRGTTYPTADHAPVFIFPNPLNPDRYVVINSGLTFREAHDRTNSLQNPKLPDWTVLGLDRLPDAEAPGRVVDAGFFDENWK
ncbi:MAG: prolyl oligopeptidase family serine peptidase [Verrucomicrobiales bacterium]